MGALVFISVRDEASEVFLWSDDRLWLAIRDRKERPSEVGAIHFGRVTAIDRNLGAAFVDLGGGKHGFLRLNDTRDRPTEGQSFVVEIRRDGWLGKGPRLSRSIDAAAEFDSAAPITGQPRLLHPAPPAWKRLLASMPQTSLDEIVFDRRVDVTDAQDWAQGRALDLARKMRAEAPNRWSRGRDQALDEIALALEEAYDLPGGGRLLFEPVRTLTAIDVDSAGANAEGFEVDLAAAQEIPRQLSLRNLGGVVVIDFIDVKGRGKRERIVQALRDGAKGDPMVEWVGTMSRLGLVEMQRRRRGPALAEMWSDVFEETPG